MENEEKERFAGGNVAQADEKNGKNADPPKNKLSPLSIPLEKEASVTEKVVPPDPQKPTPEPQTKRITQKEFVGKVFKRIDEKVDEKLGSRRVFPGTGMILLLLFLAPFLFRAGSDIYDLIKANLPPYLEMYGIKVPSAAPPASTPVGEDISNVLKQNEKLISQLTSLMDTQIKEAKRVSEKIVVVRPDPHGNFSFKREKKMLYEISGIDMDDPVSANAINKIKSAEVLLAMVDSFNRILLNSDEPSVTKFHLNNTAKAKRLVLKRLRQLK